MATVTFSDDDSPGTRLLRHEEELRIQHPHLTPRHAQQLVHDAHPDLVRLHNQGWPDLDPPAPTIDPGVALGKRVHELMQSREALNRAQAFEIASREMPEAAAAYRDGLRMPAPTSTREHSESSQVTRRSSDPGVEVLRLVGEAMQADRGLTHAQAQRQVLRSDPVLARHYVEAKPLPVATETPRSRTETLVEEALVASIKLGRELAQLTAPAERHYRDLSAAERARALPPRVARHAQGGNRIAPPMFFDGSAA